MIRRLLLLASVAIAPLAAQDRRDESFYYPGSFNWQFLARYPEGAKLFNAFEKSKAINNQDIASDRAGFPVVYLRERFKEQMATWGDPNVHGFRANRALVDAFLRYNLEQGAIRSMLPYERIFAASTLET